VILAKLSLVFKNCPNYWYNNIKNFKYQKCL